MGTLIRALPVSYQGDLGTLTWTAVTAPTTITKKYSWARIGNLVTMYVKISATGAGLAVTAVDFSLPSDMPVPATFASQPNSTIVAVGTGSIGASANPTLDVADGCKIYMDSGGVPQIKIERSAGLSATHVWAEISYLA